MSNKLEKQSVIQELLTAKKSVGKTYPSNTTVIELATDWLRLEARNKYLEAAVTDLEGIIKEVYGGE